MNYTVGTLAGEIASEYNITDGPAYCDIEQILGLNLTVDNGDLPLTPEQVQKVRDVHSEAWADHRLIVTDGEFLAATIVLDRGGEADEYVDDLVTSRDTLTSFIDHWGKPHRTVGEVCFWDRVQTRPGKVRGDLIVMPTVDGTLSWFNGEA